VNVPARGIGQKTMSLLNGWSQLNDLSLYEVITNSVREDFQYEKSSVSTINTRAKKQLELFMAMLKNLNNIAVEADVLQLFDQLIESIQYKKYIAEQDKSDDRWENILELRSAISDYQDFAPDIGLSAFLESAALSTDLDQMDDSGPDAVTLITLHQAKGLEFPAVFMIGMEEGLLPHRRSIDSGDIAEIEEERRLCYVGMTRARKRLYMTIATNRSMYGNYNPGMSQTAGPSRFLKDIPSHLISIEGDSRLPKGTDILDPDSSTSRREPQSRDRGRKTSPFHPGDHVKHKIFGEGVVVGCLITPLGNDFEVTVAFKGQGVKRLLASISNLEISD
jgi:DNA helicase-2/ATP-dependent DNA helicase PcrA